MMLGPLSRRHVKASDLHLQQLEDEDSIPWTYVNSQAEPTADDAVKYTSEGVSNKRRKMSRKKKDSFDIKPSKLTADGDSHSQDWTDEEELNLCHVVAISLQKTSFQSNLPTSPKTKRGLSTTANDRARAVISTDVTKELQKVSVSKLLAECFVPTQEYVDVVAKVKSGAFRRTFIGFLQSKAKRSQGLVTSDKTENNAESVSDCSSGSRETLQDEMHQESTSMFSGAEKCPMRKESKEKYQIKQNECMEQVVMHAETLDLKSRRKHVEVLQDKQTGDLKKQLRSAVKTTEKYPWPTRSSSRLKNRCQHQVESSVEDVDKDDSSTARRFSPDPLDDRTDDMENNSNCTTPENIDKYETQDKDQAAERKRNYPTPTQTSTWLAETGKVGDSKLKRNRKTTSQPSIKEPVIEVSAKVDELRNEEPNSEFIGESSQTIEVELKNVARRSKKKSSSEHEETKIIIGQLHESNTVPLLAAVQPLRSSKQNIKDEKRSFKTFRKKFLDRSLEVQHSRLALTSNIPGLRCSESSKVPANLDEYLTTQQVQQSRKSVLDACLMAQRDVSN